MFLALQQTIVQRLNQRVLVRLLDLCIHICGIQTLGSGFSAGRMSIYRLSASHDAASAAGHDFDEIIVAFAGFDLLDQFFGIGKPADNSGFVFLVLIGDHDLLDPFASAHSAVANGFHFAAAVLVGKTVDFLNWLDLIPSQENIWAGIVMMLIGFFIMGLSQVIYMKAGLCCGPRDSLLLACSRRIRKIPIGAVNVLILAVVLFAGWRLGGPIGLGTVLAVFGIGVMLQLALRLTKFEPKDVVHENLAESCARLR